MSVCLVLIIATARSLTGSSSTPLSNMYTSAAVVMILHVRNARALLASVR